MDQDLSAKYDEYLGLQGDAASRLHLIGYPGICVPPKTTIDSFEKFVALVSSTMPRPELSRSLKMCFKTYLKKTDITQLLKNGERPFSDGEVQEALRIMPVDVEGGILTDDMVDFLYK